MTYHGQPRFMSDVDISCLTPEIYNYLNTQKEYGIVFSATLTLPSFVGRY